MNAEKELIKATPYSEILCVKIVCGSYKRRELDKNRVKGLISGIILGLIIRSFITNAATLYNVVNQGVKIVIDGQRLNPTDELNLDDIGYGWSNVSGNRLKDNLGNIYTRALYQY